MALKDIMSYLPEVKAPIEKKLSFNVKLKWTLIILVSFFVLANISLYGMAQNSLDRFKSLAILLGTDFGSIISLGIGPIVMASIILQLLVGSKILNIDTKSHEGKKYFQGLQKILVFGFIIFEASVYVLMRGLEAAPGFTGIMITQLIIGGIAIMFMDEVVAKWGFGSGVSLFIVAGVGWRLFAELFQFITPQGGISSNCLTHFTGDSTVACGGKVLVFIQSFINGAPKEALAAFATILITAIIFLIVVWVQSLKIEVPLSFDRLRGYGIKWPLQFLYASNIPVILAAALIANIQLFGGLAESWTGSPTVLGGFYQGVPRCDAESCGLAFWLSSTNLLQAGLTGSMRSVYWFQAISHILFYVIFSVIFAIFWVKTAGMDAESQAKNILGSGLQIPGFRRDERVLEAVLSRYIMPLTVMGGAAIGILAAITDSLGALTSGTAILLAVMIIYQMYQNVSQQHAMDMHPVLKRVAG